MDVFRLNILKYSVYKCTYNYKIEVPWLVVAVYHLMNQNRILVISEVAGTDVLLAYSHRLLVRLALRGWCGVTSYTQAHKTVTLAIRK